MALSNLCSRSYDTMQCYKQCTKAQYHSALDHKNDCTRHIEALSEYSYGFLSYL